MGAFAGRGQKTRTLRQSVSLKNGLLAFAVIFMAFETARKGSKEQNECTVKWGMVCK